MIIIILFNLLGFSIASLPLMVSSYILQCKAEMINKLNEIKKFNSYFGNMGKKVKEFKTKNSQTLTLELTSLSNCS